MVLARENAMPALVVVLSWLWLPPRFTSMDCDLEPLTSRLIDCDFEVFWVSGIGFLVLLVVETVPTGRNESVTL